MRFAMLGMLFAGLAGLLLTIGTGLGWIPTDEFLVWHWQIAIWTVLLLLSAHTLVLFYFLATGKQLRVLMQESGRPVDMESLSELRLFKAKVFPPLMLALLATIASFVVGAGVRVRTVPSIVHLILGFVALAANLHACVREVRYIHRNWLLIQKIEREYLS